MRCWRPSCSSPARSSRPVWVVATCTYRLPGRLLVVRHDAAYRDVAAALMATDPVLAIAAYTAPARRTDEAASARG